MGFSKSLDTTDILFAFHTLSLILSCLLVIQSVLGLQATGGINLPFVNLLKHHKVLGHRCIELLVDEIGIFEPIELLTSAHILDSTLA